MKTYAVRRARTKTTGHIRVPGSRDLYCGKPAGAPNDYARTLPRFKMCARCVKAEAADRAEATATAEAWLDQPAKPPALTEWERGLLAADVNPGQRYTTADENAAAGTWRAEWISARAASPTPTLFDVEPADEQGALFA